MNLIFSIAQEHDASAVFALYRCMIGTPHCTWNEYYPAEDIVLRDIQAHSLYILKDEQDTLIAAATAGADDELQDLSWGMKNLCELARVVVAIQHQNKGIGTFLLQNTIPAVRARGFDGICMLVNKDHTHALALYEKNGFTRCGNVKRYGFDFYMYQMVFS